MRIAVIALPGLVTTLLLAAQPADPVVDQARSTLHLRPADDAKQALKRVSSTP